MFEMFYLCLHNSFLWMLNIAYAICSAKDQIKSRGFKSELLEDHSSGVMTSGTVLVYCILGEMRTCTMLLKDKMSVSWIFEHLWTYMSQTHENGCNAD